MSFSILLRWGVRDPLVGTSQPAEVRPPPSVTAIYCCHRGSSKETEFWDLCVPLCPNLVARSKSHPAFLRYVYLLSAAKWYKPHAITFFCFGCVSMKDEIKMKSQFEGHFWTHFFLVWVFSLTPALEIHSFKVWVSSVMSITIDS